MVIYGPTDISEHTHIKISRPYKYKSRNLVKTLSQM